MSHFDIALLNALVAASNDNILITGNEHRILDAGEGVRLQGFLSRCEGSSRGLVILLHGWEGSANSAYIVSTGRYLYDRGFDVFRLNLRDHGDSHHLNEGLFYGTLIEESHEGVRAAAAMSRSGSAFLIG